MKARSLGLVVCTMSLAGLFGCSAAGQYRWAVHDKNRPLPVAVAPGEKLGDRPSDAAVLFDGTDLDQWESAKGGAAKWKVENGYVEVVKGARDIRTKTSFGSCQLHIEWSAPSDFKGSMQDRGNSGVFLMDKYEVQVLDSVNNRTYADGQAAAIYGQNPPLVNASREGGKWQSFDIIFHRPIFKGKKVVRPATVTVLHNGVLVQDNWIIEGPTEHKKRARYTPHAEKLPLRLQDHKCPVRYRNIWVRELGE